MEKTSLIPLPSRQISSLNFLYQITFTATPSELHILEDLYLVKFSAHIRKNLHIMQYTRPDMIYAVNRLSIHDSAPSEPVFQGIKHIIRYLDGCPYRPIMYPSGLGDTTTHDLHQ